MNRSLTLSLIALLANANALAADITLQAVSRPAQSIVRLGDIATIAGGEVAEAERLAALPLMPTPAPAAVQHVRAQALKELLQALGEPLSSHRFNGAISIEIRGPEAPPQPFAVERTESANIGWRPSPTSASAVGSRTVTNAGQNSGPTTGFRIRSNRGPSGRMTSRQRRTISEALLAAANRAARAAGLPDTLRATPLDTSTLDEEQLRELAGAEATLVDPDDARPGETTLIRFPAARGVKTLVVTFAEVRQVIVASRGVRRGELLTSANVELRVEQPGDRPAPADAFESLSSVAGLEARRGLREGEPLTPSSCIGPLLVRRGEAVTVSSGTRGVRVRVRGVAKQDGRKGDVISVAVHDGDRLEASVVGPSRLAILGGLPIRQLAISADEGGLR